MFKQILTILAIASLAATQVAAQQSGPPAPAVQTHTSMIHKRTGLRFATLEPLSSTTASVGDDVPLRLASPLVVNGVKMLAEGELVHAKVVQVKRADQHCSNGDVALGLDTIALADGSTLKVRVFAVYPVPDAPVPDRLSHKVEMFGGEQVEMNNWWDVFAAVPIFILNYAVWSPVLVLLPFLSPFSHCDTPGTEFNSPANATVAVEVRSNHKVRY